MKHILLSILFLFITAISFAQQKQHTQQLPPSFYSQTINNDEIDHIVVHAPSQNLIDSEITKNEKDGTFTKIAILQPVKVSTKNSGTWSELSNGTKIWRVRFSSEGAKASALYFDKFDIPVGSCVYVYSNDKKIVDGPYSRSDCPNGNEFVIGNVISNDIVLEYVSPANKSENGKIEFLNIEPNIIVGEYAYVYRDENIFASGKRVRGSGFGGSQDCEENVNCYSTLSVEKGGVARIYVREGYSGGWCTGSLINNTSFDGTPYFLTANHCGPEATASDFAQWKFRFNYEAPSCSNPLAEYQINFTDITGCTKIAEGSINGGSDFYLVKLTNFTTEKATVLGAVYNGWDRSSTAPSGCVGIHHPAGDIKKISYSTSTPTTGSYTGTDMATASNAHWKVKWTGDGVTEGGSSGSPIFNTAGKIFGTLSGGASSCNATSLTKYDLYGKFSIHWSNSVNGSGSQHKLQPWLDPNNTGATTCEMYNPANGGSSSGSAFSYDFESCTAWSVDNFSPCTTADGDGLPTYVLSNSDFFNEGYTGSFICFESGLANGFNAHRGTKFGVCMAANPGPNNDWFILPPMQISSSSKFSLWARSATDQYGLETFKIGTSLDDNTYTMTNELEAPVEWTLFEFDLSEYAGQTRYIAIKCTSNDKFAFFIDDIEISGNVESKDLTSLEKFVNIYPNPASKQITVSLPKENATINIINVLGQVVKTISTNTPTTTINIENLEKGMYIFNIELNDKVINKKVTIE